MNSLLCIACCFMLMISSVAVGDNDSLEDRERVIYFCHRDGEFSPDIFLKEKRDGEDDLSNNEVRNISSGLARPVYYARHCFFMMADKEREYKQQDKILVSLDDIETIGYGKVGRIAKGVGYGGEGDNYMKYKPIACVPIITNSVHEITLVEQQLGIEYAGKASSLDKIWTVLLDLAYKQSWERYNFFSDNCCTFAYNLAGQIIGESRALAIIKPNSFNWGMGITKGQWPGFFADKAASIIDFTRRHYKLVVTTGAMVGGWLLFKKIKG